MAKKKPTTTEEPEFLTAEQVYKALGITMEEHFALTGTPGYPKSNYGPLDPVSGMSPFLGYRREEVESYLASKSVAESPAAVEAVSDPESPVESPALPLEQMTEVRVEQISLTSEDVRDAFMGLPGQVVKPLRTLPDLFGEARIVPQGCYVRDVSIPLVGMEDIRSLSFASGFSAQWSPDEMMRLKKLIAGLVRSGESYVDYSQAPNKRHVVVRSNIQNALKWLLRKCVPLTPEELQTLNLDKRVLEGQVEF